MAIIDFVYATSAIEWIYTLTFFMGLAYAILVGIFGGVFGVDHGHDAGIGADASVGHEVHMSPLSPAVIAMFLTSFGGTGIVCLKMFEIQNIFIHLPVSALAGVIVSAATFLFFYKMMRWAQGSSLTSRENLVGVEAEVIIPIPGEEKLGEIAYIANGTRYNSPARSEDGTSVQAHTVVVISRIIGNTIFVQPKHQIFK